MKILLQQIITGISIGSIYALIASGYALVYSLLDFSNWAHGEVCMLGAYVCFMATQVDAIPFWLACVIGIGGAAANSADGLFPSRSTFTLWPENSVAIEENRPPFVARI